jgi:hypothetical protein
VITIFKEASPLGFKGQVPRGRFQGNVDCHANPPAPQMTTATLAPLFLIVIGMKIHLGAEAARDEKGADFKIVKGRICGMRSRPAFEEKMTHDSFQSIDSVGEETSFGYEFCLLNCL